MNKKLITEYNIDYDSMDHLMTAQNDKKIDPLVLNPTLYSTMKYIPESLAPRKSNFLVQSNVISSPYEIENIDKSEQQREKQMSSTLNSNLDPFRKNVLDNTSNSCNKRTHGYLNDKDSQSRSKRSFTIKHYNERRGGSSHHKKVDLIYISHKNAHLNTIPNNQNMLNTPTGFLRKRNITKSPNQFKSKTNNKSRSSSRNASREQLLEKEMNVSRDSKNSNVRTSYNININNHVALTKELLNSVKNRKSNQTNHDTFYGGSGKYGAFKAGSERYTNGFIEKNLQKHLTTVYATNSFGGGHTKNSQRNSMGNTVDENFLKKSVNQRDQQQQGKIKEVSISREESDKKTKVKLGDLTFNNSKAILLKTFNRYMNFPKSQTSKRKNANQHELKAIALEFDTNESLSGLFKSGKEIFKKNGNKRYLKFRPYIGGYEDQDLPKVEKKRGYNYKMPNCNIKVLNYTFRDNGFTETHKENWTLLWNNGSLRMEQYLQMQYWQKCNQFPRLNELTRKDCMNRNISKMAARFGKAFEFVPKTYLLPQEMSLLMHVSFFVFEKLG